MAERCLTLRQGLGLTQQQLADKAGLDRAEWSRYETGQQLPNLVTLERVCRTLNVDPEYFLEGWPS